MSNLNDASFHYKNDTYKINYASNTFTLGDSTGGLISNQQGYAFLEKLVSSFPLEESLVEEIKEFQISNQQSYAFLEKLILSFQDMFPLVFGVDNYPSIEDLKIAFGKTNKIGSVDSQHDSCVKCLNLINFLFTNIKVFSDVTKDKSSKLLYEKVKQNNGKV